MKATNKERVIRRHPSAFCEKETGEFGLWTVIDPYYYTCEPRGEYLGQGYTPKEAWQDAADGLVE